MSLFLENVVNSVELNGGPLPVSGGISIINVNVIKGWYDFR